MYTSSAGLESPTLRHTKRQLLWEYGTEIVESLLLINPKGLLCSCFLENNVEEGTDPVFSKFHMKVS